MRNFHWFKHCPKSLCIGKKKGNSVASDMLKIAYIYGYHPTLPPRKRWKEETSSFLALFKGTELKKVFSSGLSPVVHIK